MGKKFNSKIRSEKVKKTVQPLIYNGLAQTEKYLKIIKF